MGTHTDYTGSEEKKKKMGVSPTGDYGGKIDITTIARTIIKICDLLREKRPL